LIGNAVTRRTEEIKQDGKGTNISAKTLRTDKKIKNY
jgi:hypothetical protein